MSFSVDAKSFLAGASCAAFAFAAWKALSSRSWPNATNGPEQKQLSPAELQAQFRLEQQRFRELAEYSKGDRGLSSPSIVLYDGKFKPEAETYVPSSDRGLHFGDGVFIAVHVKDGLIELWDDHWRNFVRDAQSLNLDLPEINLGTVRELIRRNGATQGSWRLKVSAFGRAAEAEAKALPKARTAHTLISMKKSSSRHASGVSEIRCGWFPEPVMIPFRRSKTFAHLMGFIALDHAKKSGVDDVVLTTESGVLLELSFSNIFWRDDRTKRVLTPSRSLPLYFGAALQCWLASAEALGYTVEEGLFKIEDIPSHANVYRCNSFELAVVTAIGSAQYARDHEFETQLAAKQESLLRSRSAPVNATN